VGATEPQCPEQGPRLQNARALTEQGKLLRASDELQALLQQCPDHAEASLRLAELWTELGRFDEARRVLDAKPARSAGIDAGGPWASAVARLDAAAAARARAPEPRRALQLYGQARLAELAGDHGRARQGYVDAWTAWPEQAEYLVTAGLSARAASDPAGAQRLLDRAFSALEARHGKSRVAPAAAPFFSSSYLHASLSDDARFVVTTSGDSVAVHDTRSRQCLVRFVDRSYPKPVVARMSPDNSVVAIGNSNGSLQLIEAATGKLVYVGKGHTGAILDLAFRADGAALATSSEDRSVRLWEAQTGKPLQVLNGHTGPARRVAFTADGATVVSTSEDSTARIWNASDGSLRSTLKGHGAAVRGLSIRRDGSLLATSSDDKTVRLWDLSTGRELRVLRGHTAAVWRVAFHPDGSQLASFGADRTVRVWNASTGNVLNIVPAQKPSGAAAFRWDSRPQEPQDSERLASAAALPILGAAAGAPSGLTPGIAVVDVMYRADGRLHAFDLDTTTNDLAVRLWDVDQNRTVQRLGPQSEVVGASAWDASGGRLATAMLTGNVRVWDIKGGAHHPLLRVSGNQLRSVAWLPGRDSLAIGDSKGGVYLVTLAGPVQLLGKHATAARALAATPDGKMLASCSESGELALWSTDDGKRLKTFNDPALARMGTAAFRADGKMLTAGSAFHATVIVDVATGAVVTAADKLPAAMLGFTPDGASVALLGADGTFGLVDAASGATKAVERGSDSAVHLCAWLRAMRGDDHACLQQRKSPRFWSAGSQRLPLHTAIAVSADLVASGSVVRGIELWRPSREGVIATLLGPGDEQGWSALAGGQAEVFGESGREAVVCEFGEYRTSFDVCEERLSGRGLLPAALRGDAEAP
jgi:WD40 repeat protein